MAYTVAMRVYLESLGCRLNYAEMASLGRQLVAAGHQLVASAAEADLCVLNSCTVTGEAARQSRQLARQMARANPAARLIMTGCYATLEEEAVRGLPNVTLVVGNPAKDELLRLIEETGSREQGAGGRGQASKGESATLRSTQHAVSITPFSPRTRAFVKVQDGCRNRCTFCIVTVARGRERSRPITEVVAEINALHAEGYQEAVLTGVHLGGYGSDLNTDLRTLVEALLANTTIPRLRLSSLEPFDLAPDFFKLWPQSNGRLMPHLHLPAQSGSDAVLRRMARRNRVADFEALVAVARALIPGLTVTTDLIAGFPGETEADFAETLAFARRVGFAHIHAFPYSARAGTAAARFADQVPGPERKQRVHLLTELDAELGRAVRASFIGQTRPVLWEGRTRKPAGAVQTLAGYVTTTPEASANGWAVWSGFTDNYLRVLAHAPADLDLHNRILPVALERLEGDILWGSLLPDSPYLNRSVT
ncbi:MAG: tRNA (N(6)-L-threonylcarbamoyladenosine(37)-C(2))-methylthiotransferase MtaB [Anaerolineae bacterium]